MTQPKKPRSTIKVGAIDRIEDANDELKAYIEELENFKKQYQHKILELESTNNDLKNLLSCSDIATLSLDRHLHIKWITQGMQRILKLENVDISRPISDFSEALIGDDLITEAKKMLKRRSPVEKEVNLNARWYLRRMLPSRTEAGRIDGVIITFADITESKHNAETLEKRVLERTAQLRALTVELSLAEERERRALAQDLHDDLGQVLAAAKIKVSTLNKLEHAQALKKRIQEVGDLLDQAHTSVRSLTFQLSPPVLFELGLVPALEWLADEMHRLYDLKIKIFDDGIKKKLDTSVSTILFRAARELLINVAKHAKISYAKVTLQHQDKHIVIQVMDKGIGLQEPSRARKAKKSEMEGFGLLSVRERLRYIGGEMQMQSVPGDGTIVTLTAPLSITRTPVKQK